MNRVYTYSPHRSDFGRDIGLRLLIYPVTGNPFVIDFDQDLKAFHTESKADVDGIYWLKQIILEAGIDFIDIVQWLRRNAYDYKPIGEIDKWR